MTNQERPDEQQARALVEAALGVTLDHADTNGDVDYRFTTMADKGAALEVTTVTSRKNKIARDHWNKESPKYGPAPSLRQCWQVWIDDNDVRYRRLVDRLEPALVVFEQAQRRFDRGRLHELFSASEFVRQAAGLLADEKVVQALPYPELCQAEGHAEPHRIEIFRQSGGSASGSDSSLTLIEHDLNGKADNFGKLRGADEKHLFVWVDADTDLAVALPFRGGRATEWDHFGLPTRPPSLMEPVDQLWIIDRATLTGWVWTSMDGWAAMSASER